MAKNRMLKEVKDGAPYAVFQSLDGWTWNVLKVWQADSTKPYARWLCKVVTPMSPTGDWGDVYVSDIVQNARLTDWNHDLLGDDYDAALRELLRQTAA